MRYPSALPYLNHFQMFFWCYSYHQTYMRYTSVRLANLFTNVLLVLLLSPNLHALHQRPSRKSLYQCLFDAIPNIKSACAIQRLYLNYVTKVFIGSIPKTNNYLRRPGAPLFCKKNCPLMQTNLPLNDF